MEWGVLLVMGEGFWEHSGSSFATTALHCRSEVLKLCLMGHIWPTTF